MSWLVAARRIAALQRRVEREQARRFKALAHQQVREAAAYAVDLFDSHIALITSVQKECGPTWDWQAVKQAPPPSAPVREANEESYAASALQAFRPGFFAKLFGLAGPRRAELQDKPTMARQRDDDVFAKAMRDFEAEVADWHAMQAVADAILARDITGYIDAIRDVSPFDDITAVGTDLAFRTSEAWFVEVELTARGSHAIPKQQVSLTKTGKASVKDMPKTRYYELLQDYVCGCVLRAAREVFALLPVDVVIVNARDDDVDPATGNTSTKTALSVVIPRAIAESLNYDARDPSDAMTNFVHRMGFKRGKGFVAVEPMTVHDVPVELTPAGGRAAPKLALVQ